MMSKDEVEDYEGINREMMAAYFIETLSDDRSYSGYDKGNFVSYHMGNAFSFMQVLGMDVCDIVAILKADKDMIRLGM